jgi:hypothetical protein
MLGPMQFLMWATIPDRVWYALYCLERDAKGDLPAVSHLEAREGLSNGIIMKLAKDKRPNPGVETIERVARALSCDFTWLATGQGQAPAPSPAWPIPVRPGSAADQAERARRSPSVATDNSNPALPSASPVADSFVEMSEPDGKRIKKARVLRNADKANKKAL